MRERERGGGGEGERHRDLRKGMNTVDRGRERVMASVRACERVMYERGRDGQCRAFERERGIWSVG